MTGEMNQQRFKALLKETITLLCSNGLNYKSEFSIEAVIGITIDQESILLVSIQDTVSNNAKSMSASQSISTRESISVPQLLQADCVKNRFTASPSRMLKPSTDKTSPRNAQNDKDFEDIAIEIVPVLHQSEDFESTHFAKCADGLNIKLEQTEDSFELKLDNRSSSSCESIQAKPTFASDEISLSCAEVQSLDRLQKACFSNGERHAFRETHTVEKQEEEFPGVVSDSRTILETSTLNNNLNINRTMQSYTMEETLGGRTSVGHPDSEIATASIRTSTVALPRVHSVRKSYVLPNNLQDMQVRNFMQLNPTYAHLSWFLYRTFTEPLTN